MPRGPCRFFPHGKCKKGDACLFIHDASATVPPKVAPPPPHVITDGPIELTRLLEKALLCQWQSGGQQNRLTQGFFGRNALMNPGSVEALLEVVFSGRGVFKEGVEGVSVDNCGGRNRQMRRLLDPFCGTGTTLVEGMVKGYSMTGCDISPLAVGIARAQTTICSDDVVASLRLALKKLFAALEGGSNLVENVGGEARVIVDKAVREECDVVKLLVWYLYDFEERYVWEDWRPQKTLVERMKRTSKRFLTKLSELREATPENTERVAVYLHDAKEDLRLENIDDEDIFDGVVSSGGRLLA